MPTATQTATFALFALALSTAAPAMHAVKKDTARQLADKKDWHDLASRAVLTNATVGEVEAVLKGLGQPARVKTVILGKTVHLWKVGEVYKDKICHHYAFGGLHGTDEKDFNIVTLATKLGKSKHSAYGDVPDMTKFNGTIDVAAQVPGVAEQGTFDVRMDDIDHSWRLEGGKWWHKFNGLPFLISVEGADNLYYNATHSMKVKSANCVGGAKVSFRIADE